MSLSEVRRTTITEADERRSARGGAFSMFVDSFDVYLPALVLPAAMAYFMPAGLSAEIRATITTLLFTVGLLGRPIGSVLLGNLSDRIGRKRVTMISGWAFTILTLLMGLMPGYAQWGYGAIVVFAVLRLVGGIFLAGGYAAPIPLALEQAHVSRRGRVGGLIAIGAPAALLVMNALLLGVLDGRASWRGAGGSRSSSGSCSAWCTCGTTARSSRTSRCTRSAGARPSASPWPSCSSNTAP
jgi:MFS family permease